MPAFLDIVEEIKESGFLYVKMRRRRLNSGDDILYLIPKVREIIENIILEELKIKNFIDIQYNSNIYKKYLKDIISIHESGGIFEKNKLNIEDEEKQSNFNDYDQIGISMNDGAARLYEMKNGIWDVKDGKYVWWTCNAAKPS